MKTKTTIAALSILSVLSFSTLAAQSISTEQAKTMQSIGTISVNGVDGTLADTVDALSKKADEQGASAYHITEAYQNGNWHATAVIYK